MHQLDPKAQPAPTPAQAEDQPKRGKPDGAPGTFDTIPDVDACPSVSAVRPK